MSTYMINIATIIGSLVIITIVMLFSGLRVSAAKSEISYLKNLLRDISKGTFSGDISVSQLKESADVVPVIQSIAKEVQQQQTQSGSIFTDELTGLANKRRFESELERSFHFAMRGLPICVVTIDINNILGEADHDKKDMLVNGLVRILQTSTRKTDLAAKIENNFVLILPNMEARHIRIWLTGLNKQFLDIQRNGNLDAESKNLYRLRFGYSFVLQDEDANAKQVFNRASEALAKTKLGNENNIIEG